LNQLLLKKSKLNLQGSSSWKVFLFPSLLKLASVVKKKQQYFGLDLVEEETERTVWTHKPSTWQCLFETVHEFAETGKLAAISTMFNGILASPVRAVPNGPNEIKSFRSQKGQIIQHLIMLVPMPADIDSSEYIPQFISKFQDLSKKQFIRSAYQTGIAGITQHSGLLHQILEDGNYWNVIDKAVEKDTIFNSNNCLSEVLLDSTIKEIVSLMFGVKKDPNTWTDSIKTYAFGN
jgi:hypothetical protein